MFGFGKRLRSVTFFLASMISLCTFLSLCSTGVPGTPVTVPISASLVPLAPRSALSSLSLYDLLLTLTSDLSSSSLILLHPIWVKSIDSVYVSFSSAISNWFFFFPIVCRFFVDIVKGFNVLENDAMYVIIAATWDQPGTAVTTETSAALLRPQWLPVYVSDSEQHLSTSAPLPCVSSP